MKQIDDRHIDRWLRQTTARFVYPPTPDVRAPVRSAIDTEAGERRQPAPLSRPHRRTLAWAVFAILLIAVSLLLVPQVRASILQILRAGGITIFVTDATPNAGLPVTTSPTAPTTTAAPRPSFLVPVTPVTLAQATQAWREVGVLPSSISPFGVPQEVYVDDEAAAQVAILVWDTDDERRLVLYVIAARDFATKQAETVTTTMVNGQDAYWIDGPHGFLLHDGDIWDTETTGGPVLIWTEGDLTYRLEGAFSLEEARLFAEAMQS